MPKREFTEEELRVLRKIVTGGHPSPGSAYLGWPESDRWLIEISLKLALADERVERDYDIADLNTLVQKHQWRFKR